MADRRAAVTRTDYESPFNAAGRPRAPGGESIDGPCGEDATTLATSIAHGRLRAVLLATAFLDRIEALNPRHTAIVSLRERDDILAEAEAADLAVREGRPLGPLHGLPIAIKDLASTRGLRTTFGSPIHADFVPEEDGLAVSRIRKAGAIVVGKTNTPEFGLGSHTFNPVFGATGNAYDPTLSAGGSSGGAAVALAARMLPLADGSDMGGSLRNPAAFNNVFGLRPSFGRVPSLPTGDVFSASLSTDGPMARSPSDLRLLLRVMAGPDTRQPLSAGLPPIDDDGPKNDQGRTWRVGWLGDWNGALPTDDSLIRTCETALSRLEAGGRATVTSIDAGFDIERLWQAFVTLRHITVAGAYADLHADPARRTMMKPELVWEIENGLRLSPLSAHGAALVRSEWHQTLLGLFARYDLIALPAAQVWPFDKTKRWPDTIAGRSMDSYHRWMQCVVPGTLAGGPVLAAPAGFDAGRSTGLQFLAPIGREADLLAFAEAYRRSV